MSAEEKQIFGYTECAQPAAGEYVRFVSAFVTPEGKFLLRMRNEKSEFATMELPLREAGELACQINMAIFPFLPTART